ncbi:MAG: MFS transporter [Desulfobacterales bacterium]|jgi:MFS family permease
MYSKQNTDSLFGVYYGWIIVAVALISMAVWFGIRTSFSVFYVAILEEFHWNRGDTAGVQSLALIFYSIMAPIVGGLIDRFGPGRIIVPGIMLLSLGMVSCSTTDTLFQFYFFYGVMVGAGVTCISPVSYSAILVHWFAKRRGLASGVAVSGIGLGTFLWVPLSQNFISLWGWRLSFVILGGLFLSLLLPLNSILLRHKPQKNGQRYNEVVYEKPYIEPQSGCSNKETSENSWIIIKDLFNSRLWALMACSFLAVAGTYIILVHNVKFLVDQGMDKMTAAFIFALTGVISSIFRIFWGWLSDRIGRESTYTFGMFCGIISVCSLLLLEGLQSRYLVYTFLFFFSMGWGVTAPIFMAKAADLFKGKIFGLIYGFVEAAIGIGGGFGAWVAGFIFDKTHSYQLAFFLVIIVFILSCFFMWLLAPPKAHFGKVRSR